MAMCNSLGKGAASEWSLMRRHESEKHFGIQLAAAKRVEATRRYLLSFTHRYVPVGLLERPRITIQQKNPPFYARSDLEQLLGSSKAKDWTPALRHSETPLNRFSDSFDASQRSAKRSGPLAAHAIDRRTGSRTRTLGNRGAHFVLLRAIRQTRLTLPSPRAAMQRTSRLLLLVAVVCAAIQSARAHVHTTPFELGDEIQLECRRNLTAFPDAFTATLPARPSTPPSAGGPASTTHGAIGSAADDLLWGPGLVCAENGRPLSFQFGRDGFVSCGWFLANDDLYRFAAGVVQGDIGFNCRVPMSKDRSFFLPVSIALWGVVEPGHLHINQHANFIFHVDEGRIVGAAAYPVRDKFQYTRVKSMLNLHGPVKWFQKHSYMPLGQSATNDVATGLATTGTGVLGIMLWCLVSILLTSIAATLLYVLRLKPMLAKKYLKGD